MWPKYTACSKEKRFFGKNVREYTQKEGESQCLLVPEFDESVPSGGGNFRRLVRMPEDHAAHGLVRLPPGQDPRRLPVPDEHLAVGVTRNHVTVDVEQTDVYQNQFMVEFMVDFSNHFKMSAYLISGEKSKPQA